MATTKTTTPRKRTTKAATTKAAATKSATARTTTPKPRAATTASKDDSLVARTGRTIKDKPYTSAAIATGAVGVVAVAAGAAYLLTRGDKSFKEASGELATKVKGGLASASESVKDGLSSASETVKDGFAGASETIKDLAERGTGYFKRDDNGMETGTETRTQQQIAEEALTLKETGALKSPVDKLSATEIKTGAIAY